ncbi:DUF2894 domain-containing protein [uncultured Ramlibacter sp.]|uniref:DUF2894 domain-containing protein n=1 Tax=uncultured Ramlibacter sp. TaxID=260755 RepID=UPI0026189EE3|nr:DUF2894 domain-containing protein [uncultured Ramlibacter sp.]
MSLARPSPLAQLNAYIQQARAARVEPLQPGEAVDAEELASVLRFRRAWGSRRALDQVAQAVARQPANPGPLNSHVLVLRTLAQMRELSPDYLLHFLVHVKGLQALERALEKTPRVAAKTARARRKA